MDSPENTPLDQADLSGAGDVSGRSAVLYSGKHLARVAEELRAFEAAMIAPGLLCDHREADDQPLAHRQRLQSLDRIIQELDGLSEILIGTASYLPDHPEEGLIELIERPRLKRLSLAVRGQMLEPSASSIVIF